jgi:hypothetical protein
MVIFFFFVRQKLIHFENRLDLMSDTIQTMAGVTRAALQDSDDSDESECSSECSSDSEMETREPTPERLTVSDDDVKRVTLPENDILEDIEVKKMVLSNEVEDLVKLPEMDKSLESLTLKELKDKVAELNGPKLKTKKELIDFLQNKI